MMQIDPTTRRVTIRILEITGGYLAEAIQIAGTSRAGGTVVASDSDVLSEGVYALADASTGAIEPGDLPMRSSSPGHCMKDTDRTRAQEAILGKAMSSLASGKGMVLVLVSLQ